MNAKVCASSNMVENWSDINFQKAENRVKNLQNRIAHAYLQGKHNKVKSRQHMVLHSFYAKLLAVKIVTTSKGRKTPGVDKVTWDTSEEKLKAVSELNHKEYNPLPLKRIGIPKSNGKRRPISIPCMKDRAMQTLYKFALEPIAELTGDPNSYAFRSNRCTQDAIKQFVKLLSFNVLQPEWLLKIDIKSCYDNIFHEWVMENIPIDKQFLQKFLKSGYIESGKLFSVKRGIPQGGNISNVICNMVLDGLEKELHNRFHMTLNNGRISFPKVHLIRYADDFIITGRSAELLKDSVLPVVEEFLKERGLQLSPDKTFITHIEKGVDFLGWNVHTYNKDVLIRPSDKNFDSLLVKINLVMERNPNSSQDYLRSILTPIISGWINYHKDVVSKKALAEIINDIHFYVYQLNGNKPLFRANDFS